MAGTIQKGSPLHNAHLAGIKDDVKHEKKEAPKTKAAALEELMAKTKDELVSIATELEIEVKPAMNKEEIAKAILETNK